MTEQNVLNTWNIPLSGTDETIQIEAMPGQVITVVGSNGSGKSALATWMAANAHGTELRRVLAQRKLWLQHAGPSISPADRASYAANMATWDREPNSRHYDHADSKRSSIVLFDLLGKFNYENHRAVGLYESGATSEDIAAAIGLRLLPTLNSVLEKAGLHVVLGVTEQQTFTATHSTLGVTYPISLMSDGERSALLLAADVLTAPDSAIVLIDEPERHLHRSISAGLIEAILDVRADCAFVVLTHDLDLATRLSTRPGRTLSSQGVVWSENEPSSWLINEVKAEYSLPESARRAILGGRKQVLFIEGDEGSIDLALYTCLFPGWSLIPAGGCESVIRAVTGLPSLSGFSETLGGNRDHSLRA